MNNKEEDFITIARFVAEHDICHEIFWDEDLETFINCNDVFYLGCNDTEPVLAKDLSLLKTCLIDAPYDACMLFCARQRKMRPQGAMYKHIDKENWQLFNACGPAREIDFCNPMRPTDSYN